MLVCTKCKKELTCVTNGISVRFREDGSHVYAGDLFRCSECGYEIVNTNRTAHYEPDAVKIDNGDIWMDSPKVGK